MHVSAKGGRHPLPLQLPPIPSDGSFAWLFLLCKPLYAERIGDGLPPRQSFPPNATSSRKPNDSKGLHPKVPANWYFGAIGIYFPGWQNPFRGEGCLARC